MFLDLGDICESGVGWYNLAKQTRELDLLNSLFSSHISHTKYKYHSVHTFCDLFRIR